MKKNLKNSSIVLSTLLVMSLNAFAEGPIVIDPGNPEPGAGRPLPRPPHPTPAPTSTSAPAPVDTGSALRRGQVDGQSDGAREGNARGPAEGGREGRERGFREGLGVCERQERQQAYDRGYQDGFGRGEIEGRDAGDRQGRYDGDSKGNDEGRADGLRRADRDADQEASPRGRAKGIQEADASDASARGAADGLVAGDRDALKEAQNKDYPRGKKDYRDERYAEPVDSEDSFPQALAQGLSQIASKSPVFSQLFSRLSEVLSDRANATPDRRFYNPRANYPTPQENQAYVSGYDSGYNSGFQSAYQTSYRHEFDRQHRLGYEDGCRKAHQQDYRLDYGRGFDEGRGQGYSRAYQYAYDQSYRYAYDSAFRAASERAYQESYQDYYNRHFEEARAAAYAERVNDLYRAAFDRTHRQKFDEMYPKYAAQEYQRGRADEAQDFQVRPVRLIDAEVLETIPNGLHEPGEALRMKVKLRNFAAGAVAGRDVKVRLQALDASSAVITQGEAVLSRDLSKRSLTTISSILEFRLNEEAVNQAKSFRLSVQYQGRASGERTLSLTPKFVMDMDFAEAPVLREGMESVLKLRVKNQSNVATDAATNVQLRSASAALEIIKSEASVGILDPGEERVVEFLVVGRQGGNPELSFAFEVKAGTGRRIGLYDETREVPVMNDYTVSLVSTGSAGAEALRKSGVVRLEYTAKNVSSRVIMKSLQLKVRITPKSGDPFVVMGPNPQYLSPLLKGQSMTFMVPILVREENGGGTLELEIEESGRTVVIHRVNF